MRRSDGPATSRMLQGMNLPNWAEELQAYTSLATAGFTFLSLICLVIYTEITRRSFRTAQKAYEEGTRPVLMLVKVKPTYAGRVALYRNTGQGIAINIRRVSASGDDSSSSNVLAPNRVLLIELPDAIEDNFIEMRYEALNGKELCTISYFLRDGRPFNEYIPDASNTSANEMTGIYTLVKARAGVASSRRLLAKVMRQTRKGDQ